jgi:glutamate-1-semialdehyde 2,1-aminomutase
MTPLGSRAARISSEYPYKSISAGVPLDHHRLVHPINFNDLASVEYVCRKYPVAALITEPILQNIGIVKPEAGYLEGLRKLADRFGFLLVFDEVKTGFRHGLAGYAGIAGVKPDLAVYGLCQRISYRAAWRKEELDGLDDPSRSLETGAHRRDLQRSSGSNRSGHRHH